jgi:prepilin-type processing-associated H-X9-DG protein
LGQAPLYNAYDFTEPWDGPNNMKLLASRHSPYACHSNHDANIPGASQTTYLAVVGPQAAWNGDKSRKLADFGKDAASTIMLIEVADSDIPWTEPRDYSADTLTIADDKRSPVAAPSHRGHYGFFSTTDYGCGANAAMADGSVQHLPSDALSVENLPKMLHIGGCKVEEVESFGEHLVESTTTNWPNIAALSVWLLSVGTLLTIAVRRRKTLPISLAR